MGAQAPGLDAIRLSEAGREAVRLEVQGHHRLRERRRRSTSRWSSGEVYGTIGQLVDAQGDQRATWIKDKKIRILAQWALRKHPELPDVPLDPRAGQDRGAEAGAESRRWRASSSAGRSSCRPTCRRSASSAIRRAFDAAMKDPALLAEAEKLKIEIDPLTGEQVAALITRDLANAGRDRRARARRGDRRRVERQEICRQPRQIQLSITGPARSLADGTDDPDKDGTVHHLNEIAGSSPAVTPKCAATIEAVNASPAADLQLARAPCRRCSTTSGNTWNALRCRRSAAGAGSCSPSRRIASKLRQHLRGLQIAQLPVHLCLANTSRRDEAARYPAR